MYRPKLFPHVLAAGMAMLTAFGLISGAQAQHTPDPYNIVGEYNLGYEDSMYPTYPNGAGFTSNQAILQGRVMPGRANTFQSYLDGLDGGGSGSLFGAANRSRGGIGVPYYRAHREFDDAFDRIYTPNAVPDQAFRADQETRTKLYVDYLKESDPKKRAQLYRLYNQQSLRTARDSGAGSTRAALRDRNVSSTATVRNITDQFLPAPLSLEFAHDSRFRRRVCVRDPGRDPRPGHPFDQASGRPIGLQQLVGGPPLIGFPLVPAGHFGSRAALWPLPETVVGNAFSRSPLVNAPFSRMIDSVLVRYSRLTRWDFFGPTL